MDNAGLGDLLIRKLMGLGVALSASAPLPALLTHPMDAEAAWFYSPLWF
jgi:hypothetical protein